MITELATFTIWPTSLDHLRVTALVTFTRCCEEEYVMLAKISRATSRREHYAISATHGRYAIMANTIGHYRRRCVIRPTPDNIYGCCWLGYHAKDVATTDYDVGPLHMRRFEPSLSDENSTLLGCRDIPRQHGSTATRRCVPRS